MLDFLNALFRLLSPLWEMSVTAAYVAVVVIVLRLLLKKRAPRQVLCLLWLVVFARLLIPASLESPLSIVPSALPGQEYLGSQAPGRPGAGNPVIPATPRNPVYSQTQNQPGNGAGTPAAGNPNPPLSVPEGVGPAASTAEAPAAFPWQAVAAGVWLTGAAAMGGYALVSYLRLRCRLFDAICARDRAWEHPAVDSPFILGVLRPRIYLPAGLAGQPRQFILCHERAHLRRLDHIVKPVCWTALALHWFNPLVWTAFLLMSRDIESACDEAVVRQLGSGVKADYSDTLLALATGRRIPAPCPLAFDEGDAGDRIRNVLNYRRPALWVIVISVVAAALAAVCLLTDPVTAKDPEGGPAPGASASHDPDATATLPPVNLADDLLDPWMKEFLDGEREFVLEGAGSLSVDRLAEAFFGPDPEYQYERRVTVSRVAIIDLDRDGISEMVVWPSLNGDDSIETVSVPGYLILRRQGDVVYGYNPPFRGFAYLKADGTFEWNDSAFEGGTASMSFDGDQYELNFVTWCDIFNEYNPRYFVDGLKADREEFLAALDTQDAKPEPTWYGYKDGVLSPWLVEPGPGLNSPPVLGTTETFTWPYCDFKVEVTNVREVRKEIGMMDGGVLGEYTVFVCYPGAVVTVLNVGMSDPAWADDGLSYPNYGFLWYPDENTEDTLPITEDTGPVEVTSDLTWIYFLESCDGLLKFELYSDNAANTDHNMTGGDAYTFHVQVAGGRNLTVVLDTPQPQENYFAVSQILIYEGDKLLQTIEAASVPQPDDYAWDGLFVNRGSWVGEPDIRDLNFDGSQDFGLLAVSSYPHNVPYSYFLWNDAEGCFDYGFTLFGSDCLKTDAEKGQLIEYSHDILGEYATIYTYAADGSLQKH